MMEKKQREQEKVEDKKVYVNVVRGKCRAEEIKGTLLKAAGRGGWVWPGELQGQNLTSTKF